MVVLSSKDALFPALRGALVGVLEEDFNFFSALGARTSLTSKTRKISSVFTCRVTKKYFLD
jgi:hypothetical protein